MIKVDKIMKTGYNYIVRKVRNVLLGNGGLYMELAKVTSKGQITIPIEIRKKLGIKNVCRGVWKNIYDEFFDGCTSGSTESICRRGRKAWT